MSKRPEVILVHETPAKSWLRDLSSVACFVALIGIGVLLGSSAMQWTGAVLGFLVLLNHGARIDKDNRFTIADARKRLDEIEAGDA